MKRILLLIIIIFGYLTNYAQIYKVTFHKPENQKKVDGPLDYSDDDNYFVYTIVTINNTEKKYKEKRALSEIKKDSIIFLFEEPKQIKYHSYQKIYSRNFFGFISDYTELKADTPDPIYFDNGIVKKENCGLGWEYGRYIKSYDLKVSYEKFNCGCGYADNTLCPNTELKFKYSFKIPYYTSIYLATTDNPEEKINLDLIIKAKETTFELSTKEIIDKIGYDKPFDIYVYSYPIKKFLDKIHFNGIKDFITYEKPYIKDNQFVIPNPEGVNKYCDFTFVGETFNFAGNKQISSAHPDGQYKLQIRDKSNRGLCQVNLDAYVPKITYNYINDTNKYTHWHSEDTINAINLIFENIGNQSIENIVSINPTYKNSEHKTFELKIGEVKDEKVKITKENISIGDTTLFTTPYNITCYPDLESITIVPNDKANSIETIVTTDKLKAYPNIDVKYFQLDQVCFYDTLKVKVNEITGGLSNGYTYKIDNEEEKVFPSDSIIPIPHEGDKYFNYKITFFDKNIPQEDSAHNGKISRSYETTNSAIVPDTLGVNKYEITHVACFGDSTGKIQINSLKIADPNRPISYLWNTGSVQNYIEKLPIGAYSLTLSDGTCTVESDYKIEQPKKLIFKEFEIKNAACFGYNDGAISINVEGGVEDYKYLWNNTFTTKDLEKLYAGNYHITVTDAHNCILEKDTVVTEPTKVVNNYIVHNYNICKDSELEIDAGDFSDYVWKDPSNKKLKAKNILNLDNDSPEGKYYLKTIRYDNCFAEDSINISQNDQSLKMNFLLPSEIYNDDYAKIVETSSHELDSLKWVFSENLIAELSEDSTTLTINANQLDNLSTYKIKLIGYYKGCVATVTKDLEISNLTRPEEEYLPDYYDSDEILDCRIGPNPNDGNFTLILDLTDTKDVVLTVYSINNLKFVMRKKLSGLQNYEYPVNQNLPQGKYILEVKTSKSIRRIKFIVTK